MSTFADSVTLIPAGTWIVDPAHSSVEFQVKHMGIATVKGQFTEFEGRIVVGDDMAGSYAGGTVRVASLDTREPSRDEHLRSADFFDVDRYPQLRFESTSLRVVDEKMIHIDGRLTLHGITRDIVLEAAVQGIDTDPWGNDRLGLEAVAFINRADFDMKFNQALGSGNLLVSDRVKILLDVSAVRQA